MIKRIFLVLVLIGTVSTILVLCLRNHVNHNTEQYIEKDINKLPFCFTALVLGAHVSDDGTLSYILRDRVDKALELYHAKKILRFLLTGDHSRKNYDEVNNMKKYLIKKGVATRDIFLDHAGFDTYSSLVRAQQVFGVKSVIIISQGFHLPRAVYIARKLGLHAYGCPTTNTNYDRNKYYQFREAIANVKAYFSLLFHVKPHFLGAKIPITGDSRKSYD